MFKLFKNKSNKLNLNEPHGKSVLIACFPKSGSTYISSLLAYYTGYKKSNFVHAWGAREQELEPSILEKLSNTKVIVQQHTRASSATLNLIKQHNLKVIILVRNIFDVIPSLRDHILKDPRPQPVFDAGNSFHELNSDQQLDMIIDLGAQWYIHFYVSWYRAIQEHKFDMISYEDFFLDIEKGFKVVCNISDVNFDKEQFLVAKQQTEEGLTRKNVGETGRGEKLLSPEQKSRIVKLTSYYPDVDFGFIGIKN